MSIGVYLWSPGSVLRSSVLRLARKLVHVDTPPSAPEIQPGRAITTTKPTLLDTLTHVPWKRGLRKTTSSKALSWTTLGAPRMDMESH